MTKKANSITLLEEALSSIGIALSSIEVRRLTVFTRDVATRTATVKALRNAVAQFRLDPLKLLEKRGVGIRTLQSVQTLSDLFAAQETKKEFGHVDNLAAVQAILNTMNRGVPDNVRAHLASAKNNLVHAQNLLQFDLMIGEPEPDYTTHRNRVFYAYYNCEGDSIDIANVCGNAVVGIGDLQDGVEHCIVDIERQRIAFDANLIVRKYTSEFVDDIDGAQGVYLLVKAHCVDTST
jgi:hypothetical protein